MAQNTAEGFVGTTGSIVSFATTETIVYGANAPIPTDSVEHGFTNEDGVTRGGDRSNTNILTWQGSQIMRTVTTESSATFQFTLLQKNDANDELAYGRAKNSVTGAFHVDAGIAYPHKSYFITAIDTATNRVVRYYIPDGQVTSVGEQTINAQGLISQDITITAYVVNVEGEPANYLVWDDEYIPGS